MTKHPTPPPPQGPKGPAGALALYADTNAPPAALSAPSGGPPLELALTGASTNLWLECRQPGTGEVACACLTRTPQGDIPVASNALNVTSFRVSVHSLLFNHDVAASTNDALNIRANFAGPMPSPRASGTPPPTGAPCVRTKQPAIGLRG